MSSPPYSTYSGSEPKLLLAFDLGVTHSSISYSILSPGRVPDIEGVHSFPGKEVSGASAGVPTVLYYGKDGQVCAAGAETERAGVDILAKQENWVKVEGFKFRLKSTTTDRTASTHHPFLPPGKSILMILSDFLIYLNNRAKQHILQAHPKIGATIWERPEIHYIFPHPDQWGGPQQALMRRAAEMAGLIKPHGGNKLSFVTEGEAALHRCIDGGLESDCIERGEGLIVVQAGKGTLIISAWASGDGGRTFERVAEQQRHLRGSFFVTEMARRHLTKLLQNPKFHQNIPEMVQNFDMTVFFSFRDPSEPYWIKFGSVRDTDGQVGIRGGHLRLGGKDIASFFEPSIRCLVDGVLNQIRTSQRRVSNVVLVGSFAASEYLFIQVREELKLHGVQVTRVDVREDRIISDGAISVILKQPLDTPFNTISTTTLPLSSAPTSPHTSPTIVASSPRFSLPPSPSSHFDRLTDDNYHEWKIYMTAHLVREGLLGVVDGTESQPDGTKSPEHTNFLADKKARARAELILHVSPSQLAHCAHDDPTLIWNALATAHAARRRAITNTLARQLHTLRLEQNETMSGFIGHARHLAFLIKEAGGNVGDDEVIRCIITGLPSSYDSCVVLLDALSDADYNIDTVSVRLVGEYHQRIAALHPGPHMDGASELPPTCSLDCHVSVAGERADHRLSLTASPP